MTPRLSREKAEGSIDIAGPGCRPFLEGSAGSMSLAHSFGRACVAPPSCMPRLLEATGRIAAGLVPMALPGVFLVGDGETFLVAGDDFLVC